MKEQIVRFMQDCPSAKGQAFANNPFGAFVRTEIPEALYETGLVNRQMYLITASVGAGNWAMIPWICIFDRSITISATKGVYIVYLLSKDSKRLYLTFNQGCTDIRNQHSKRETIQIMHQKADEIRGFVPDHGFVSACDIDLGDHLTDLGDMYREGTVFYKRYDVNSLPGEDVLRDDLSRMMSVYAEYARGPQKDERLGKFDSWTIVDENTAIKKCDKSFYDYNGSGVPKGVCWFFGVENLGVGETKPLKLRYQGNEYKGLVRNESADGTRRIRIFWNADLGKLLVLYKGSEGISATFYRVGDNKFELTMKGDEIEVTEEKKTKEIIEQVKAYIAARGFSYDAGLIENFYLSLRSKPFVILAGTSGTGKTRLVRLFAEAIGAAYEQVAVRPDWSDSTDLFGHVDLNGRFVPGKILEFLSEAQQNPEIPFMLCLDEMNLARVEYYLSDFLSVIETREWMSGKIVTDHLISEKDFGTDDGAREKYGEIRFPDNLYIVGTVNMDETTFPFSRKVLDRANTIEFDYVDLVPAWSDDAGEIGAVMQENGFLRSRYLKLADCAAEDRDYVSAVCAELEKINKVLARANAHVGYRVRDEIVFYLLNNREAGLLDDHAAMDNEILQKILPRIQGSSASVKSMLCDLFKEIAGDYEGYQTESNNTADRMMDLLWKNGSARYPKSARKIAFMVRRFEEDGFTSYWL